MIFGISKTTLAGALSLISTIMMMLTAYQIPAALQTPQNVHTWLWVTSILTLLATILRAIVGYLQNDAPPPQGGNK